MNEYCVQTIDYKEDVPFLILNPDLSQSLVIEKAKELKEKYGLTNMQLAFTTSVQESTISRILNNKHKTQRAILFVLNLALEEYKEYYEVKEINDRNL